MFQKLAETAEILNRIFKTLLTYAKNITIVSKHKNNLDSINQDILVDQSG